MDFQLYETLNGGDLNFSDGDIQLTEALWVQIYLSMFGGNTDPTNEVIFQGNADFKFYYWGNDLLDPERGQKLTSETETALRGTELSTAGRLKIQRAVEKDIKTIEAINEYTVTVYILGIDRVQIDIMFSEPSTYATQGVRIMWGATATEAISGGPSSNIGGVVSVWILESGEWNDAGSWIDTATWHA